MVDNQTAVAYINKMGGRKTLCNNIARKIWLWCLERNIWLSAAYISTHDNYVADEQSRISHHNSEWEINNEIFNMITDIWGVPELDLFASRLNHKIPKYVSWKPDPFSVGVDAFNMFWGNTFNYIFPPFSLVGKILQKIEEDKADVVLIAPFWPTQSWFSKLLNMLIDCPFSFYRTAHTMTHSAIETETLPRMHLIACLLSGKHYARTNFLQMLRTSSCPHGRRVPQLNMTSKLRSGQNLQTKGVTIPLHHL